MKNWFNLPSHPTDSYIHWAETKPQDIAAKIRPAWDKLAAFDKESLELLLQQAYEKGYCDSEDNW